MKTALIDMDGVLYDSMPYHARAWHRMISELGLECSVDEFFLYEGMTGRDTIDLIFRRHGLPPCSPERVSELYARKARYFVEMGEKKCMPHADRMVRALLDAGWKTVLVTGSAQSSLIDRLEKDYPGAFPAGRRITAHDVEHGKPHPEPYLKGMALAGSRPEETIVIENAPLGVRAGVAAGLRTIAVTTGPIPREAFEAEHPAMIFSSMECFADALPDLLTKL